MLSMQMYQRVCVCTVAHPVYLQYLASGLVQYRPFSRLCFLCGGGGGIRPLLHWGETCVVSILNTCSASASLPQPWKTQDSSQKYEPNGVFEQHRASWYLYKQTYPDTPPHIHHHCVELGTISDVHDVNSIVKTKSKISPLFLWQQLLETF